MFKVVQTAADRTETVLGSFEGYGSAIRYARGLMNAGERDVSVAAPVAPAADHRAADCTTTKDWERWARERREYEDPYGPIGGRY